MRDCYKPFLTIYRIERIEELITICHGLDKSMYRSYTNYPRNRMPQVNNVEGSGLIWEQDLDRDEELNVIGQAIHKNKLTERSRETPVPMPKTASEDENNVLCWNCRQYGHFWRNCDKPKKLFCHFCGQMNFITSNCPNNHRFPTDDQGNENPERL